MNHDDEREESEPLQRIVFGDDSIGCVFDGSLGWHNTYRLIDLALFHGMELDADRSSIDKAFGVNAVEAQALEAYRHSGYGDIDEDHLTIVVDQDGLSDRALSHLQALTAPGLYWGWDDGLYITPGCLEAEEPLSPADCDHCVRGQFS